MFTREQDIEEFLDEYRRSRVIIETTVRATLNRVLEFEQKFITNELHIIDDERVGVVFKDQKLFIYKDNIKDFGVDEDKLWVTDGRLTITIIVNKLWIIK